MKKQKELKDTLGILSENEIEKLKELNIIIKDIYLKPEISEKGLRKLENCLTELSVFKDSYAWRIIRILKQNHVI